MLKLRFLKKNYLKIIAFILVVVLLSLNSFTTAIAETSTDSSSTYCKNDISESLYAVFLNKVQSIQKEGEPLKISIIKTIQDFSNEKYMVIECLPQGYIIYHPNSGVFVESSPSAISPYINLTGDNLYYGGPTEYYIEKGGTYFHTVIDETINNQTDIDTMKFYSQKIIAKLNSNKNIALLDYVINKDTTAYATMAKSNTNTIESGLSQAEINWFKNLTSCGYYSVGDGVCGFVALNILYAFFDKFKDDKYMDNTYWKDSTKTQLKGGTSSFTKYLYDLDPKSSTTSMHIHSVSKQYLKEKSITDISHTSRYWGFFTKSTIKGLIDDGYPVEIFGNLENPPNYPYGGKKGGHAVVAYQYSGNNFICHYGWNNYPEVTVVGTFGSIYAMEVKES